ncbi:transcriptional regulator [Staphylococcus saprophyticus]|nr:transcriptional regulator [Staphylococcus saprophyticus]
MKILKTLLIIAVYELSKYVTNEIITRVQANDEIEQPKDYHEDSWKYQY